MVCAFHVELIFLSVNLMWMASAEDAGGHECWL